MPFGKTRTQTLTLDIEGMTCGHCAQTVTAALRDPPRVHGAHVDLSTHQAHVEVRGAPDLERLTAAVAAAGYTARAKQAHA